MPAPERPHAPRPKLEPRRDDQPVRNRCHLPRPPPQLGRERRPDPPLAGGLSHTGLGKGDRVGVLALNSERHFEALFAIPAAGAAIVPINTLLAPLEIAYILEDSGAKAVLLGDAFAAVPGQLASLAAVTEFIHLGDGPVPAGMRPFEALLDADPVADGLSGGDDLAGIFYTGAPPTGPRGWC